MISEQMQIRIVKIALIITALFVLAAVTAVATKCEGPRELPTPKRGPGPSEG